MENRKPFLDEVQERHVRRDLVAPGDRDDEAQVVVDELLLGGEVAALDALGQLELRGGGEEPEAPGLPEELTHRVDGVLHEVVVGVARGRDAHPAAVVVNRDAALRDLVAQVLQISVAELERLGEAIDLRLLQAASLRARREQRFDGGPGSCLVLHGSPPVVGTPVLIVARAAGRCIRSCLQSGVAPSGLAVVPRSRARGPPPMRALGPTSTLETCMWTSP